VSEELQHGLVAYAERQAALQERIASGHARHWLPVLRSLSIEPCWAPRYATRGDSSSNQSTTKPYASDSESDTEGDDEDVDVDVDT
jgi:hypothetical protein